MDLPAGSFLTARRSLTGLGGVGERDGCCSEYISPLDSLILWMISANACVCACLTNQIVKTCSCSLNCTLGFVTPLLCIACTSLRLLVASLVTTHFFGTITAYRTPTSTVLTTKTSTVLQMQHNVVTCTGKYNCEFSFDACVK